jgi:SSS family solute:Na+ symporter
MAWQMQDVISILIVAFTINSAALFVPTIAMVARRKIDKSAAFWSMTLSLIVVIGWYISSALELATVFSIDPLWPGLSVSVAVFAGISFFSGAAE